MYIPSRILYSLKGHAEIVEKYSNKAWPETGVQLLTRDTPTPHCVTNIIVTI